MIKTLTKVINKKSGKARSEFRFNVKTQHVNHIISADEKHDEYLALGLTSQPETFGIQNMPLTQNPQSGKTSSSYIRNGEIVEGHKAFSKKPKGNMQFAPADVPNVKAKKRNAKKNLKRQKKENKKKK